MPKLIMTKGLPASGKTTWATEQVKNSNGRTKRVNKDDLRAMIDAGQWSKHNEKQILDIRNRICEYYLSKGYDIIVDDTNLDPKHEEFLRAMATTDDQWSATFEVQDFTDVPLNECLKRNAQRSNFVPEETIKTMYNRYLKKKKAVAQYQKPPYNPELPTCIIVDIDGTLAHITDRSPYDYSKVSTDVVDENVAEIVRRYSSRDLMDEVPSTYVVIVSGREATCRLETLQWLEDNHIPYDEFYMREAGDYRDDRIVKKEIYDKWIKPRFNVRFVLDDRDRVVKMWREEGLKVLQVAEGDF